MAKTRHEASKKAQKEKKAKLKAESSKKSNKTKRKQHRGVYPTPGFKFFGVVLSLFALTLASLNFMQTMDLIHGIFVGAGVIGAIISLYAGVVEPKADNIKQRKLLVSVSLVFGLILIALLMLFYLTIL